METKWNGTIERRQGSGRPSTFTAEEDNMLLNRLRNSPFMTAVEGVNTSKYNGKERSIFGKHVGMDFSRYTWANVVSRRSAQQ
jgi:hypothetical protein